VNQAGQPVPAGWKRETNMARTNHGGEKGFSIIELMIVMSILGILITMAIFSYMSAIDRIKLQGDVRELNGTLQLARMRSISSGISHGVAFWRRDGSAKGTSPDAYFVFVDCNNDLKFTDNGDGPGNNKAINSWDECKTSLGYDPILRGEKFKPLTNGNYFTTIFGSTSKDTAKNGADLEFVAFNALGQAMWGISTLVSGDSDIFMQNHHVQKGDNTVDKAGVRVFGGSGATDLLPMSRGSN